MSLSPFVPTPKFDDYQERFKEHFRLERRHDGVLLAQAHTLGGSIQLSVENHRALGQLLRTVGADPENELLILTGSGEHFMMAIDPDGFALEREDLQHWAYEYAYKDGRTIVSALINDIEIPTIGVLNGSGGHAEICLMCEAEDAVIFDPHFNMGSVPGDGIRWCQVRLRFTDCAMTQYCR
jgi:enoyl-CoA hydratase/carnithine racemase